MTTLDIGTGLYLEEDFMHLLSQDIDRATREGRPYTVIAVVPQHLPGEGIDDLIQVAATCLREFLRDDDLGGRLNGGALAMGLPDTDATEAKVVSYRLQGDLRLRSYHLRNTVWEPGLATLGVDGSTGQELVAAAIDAALSRRRRLG